MKSVFQKKIFLDMDKGVEDHKEMLVVPMPLAPAIVRKTEILYEAGTVRLGLRRPDYKEYSSSKG